MSFKSKKAGNNSCYWKSRQHTAYNNHMHSDGKKYRSFSAPLFIADDVRRKRPIFNGSLRLVRFKKRSSEMMD